MGAYLSSPVTDTISADKRTDKLSYGASSMQGWRVSQEDAHNCLPEFDQVTDTSYFAVYDGHGGGEVAQYAAAELPEVLRRLPAYEDDLQAALTRAFLSFDLTLTDSGVVQRLKDIAGVQSEDDDDADAPVAAPPGGASETALLYEEAAMPLDLLLARYGKAPAGVPAAVQAGAKLQSPMIRAKRDAIASRADDGVKLTLTSQLLNGKHLCNGGDEASGSGTDRANNNVKEGGGAGEGDGSGGSAGAGGSSDAETAGGSAAGGGISRAETAGGGSADAGGSSRAETAGGGSAAAGGSSRVEAADGGGASSGGNSSGSGSGSGGGSAGTGGSSKEPATETAGGSSMPGGVTEMGSAGPSKVGAEDGSSEDDSSDEEGNWGSDDDEDDAEDSEDDEDDDDDDDDDEEGVEGGDEGDAAENEEDGMMSGNGEPGCDSGCTAVVAVLRGRRLYVANAGDSRAVLCRAGRAVDMSFDHKPEDSPERRRIVKAGGRVTFEGRVNGGLNLSRALGDHCYKKNAELGPEEQMITALPDVKTVTLDATDQFMLLACDGIWNVLSSQDAVDFVKDHLRDSRLSLSAICEQMFQLCLAPDTSGDGTGCDNMTAIIVTFDKLYCGGDTAVADGKAADKRDVAVDDDETADDKSDTAIVDATVGRSDAAIADKTVDKSDIAAAVEKTECKRPAEVDTAVDFSPQNKKARTDDSL